MSKPLVIPIGTSAHAGQPLVSGGVNGTPPTTGWPLLRLGFRPFYLAASIFAALAVPYWLALWLGLLPAQAWPRGVALPLLWHAHEMLFGFAGAVVVGFLFTAARAWTGLPTARGHALGALVLLWLAARIAALLAPAAVFAALDVLLLPLCAWALGRVLLRAGSRRNYPLVGVVSLLGLVNAVFHASALGWLVPTASMTAMHAALALIVMLTSLIGGRVVPMFTANAVAQARITPRPKLDLATNAATAVALAGWVFAAPPLVQAPPLLLAAVLQLARWLGWAPLSTWKRPILWILHAAVAFTPMGLLLLAGAALAWWPASVGIHALAVGTIGGLIIGMMTRTARGHTARPLHASAWEVAAYALVLVAALARVVGPLLLGDVLGTPVMQWAYLVSTIAWSAAFIIYALRFGPWLLQPRLDGKDG